MTIDSPLLTAPLTGTVYLIAHAPLPWLGVALDGQGVSVRLTGVTATPLDDPACDPTDPDQKCDSDVKVTFVNLPDLPYTHARLVIDGPDRTGIGGVALTSKILEVAKPIDSSCHPTAPALTTFVPNSGGTSVGASQNFAFIGCPGS
jgi:hypothetical protein